MQVLAAGIDTVRSRYIIQKHLPVRDRHFISDMNTEGWTYHNKQHLDSRTGELVETHNYARAHGTLREYIAGGQYYTAEFSVPKLNGSPHNLHLASPNAAKDAIHQITTAAPFPLEFDRLMRADLSVDVAAHDAMPAVISAAQQIRLERTRKTTRSIYPGETATIRGRQMSMRCYAKAKELETLKNPDDELLQLIANASTNGRTRLEFQSQLRGGMPLDYIEQCNDRLAHAIAFGFPGGSVYVAGLHNIRAQIDGMDAHASTKNSLLAFAVRYAELGEDGMRAAYSRRTFYRHRRKFLDYGLRLDDVCQWEGNIDFNPVVTQLRRHAA